MSVDAKRDVIWIVIVSVLILFWSSIPNWAGYQAATKELRFRGTCYDTQDYAVHIAAMEARRKAESIQHVTFKRVNYSVLNHYLPSALGQKCCQG